MNNSIEKKIIKLASKVNLSSSELKKLYSYISTDLDWGYLLYMVVHHRITPILYNNLINADAIKNIEKHIQRILRMECLRIKEKNRVLISEMKNINEQFLSHSLEVIDLKGASISQRLYPDPSFREFTDIDYLAEKKDLSSINKCLEESGYIQGEFVFSTKTIKPYSRKEIIEKLLTSHESPEYVKLANSDYFNSIIIDVNHSLIWNEFIKTSPLSIEATGFLKRKYYETNNVKGYRLSEENELQQLCCHFYSEAVFFMFDPSWKRDKSDINIIKMYDIYLLCNHTNINWSQVKEQVQLRKIIEPVLYALCCLEKYYDDFSIPDVMESLLVGKYDKEKLIDIYYDKNFKRCYWKCTFEDRIFNISEKVREIGDF